MILGNFNGGCAGAFKRGYSGGLSIGVTRHEMGHQFQQPHTISRGGNDNYEPENAGRSIQGGNSNPFAHSSTYHQLANSMRTGHAGTGSKISTGNNIPSIDAGMDRSIPISTPFTLSAIATDADAGDVMTYVWDQLDRGIAQSLPTVDPTGDLTDYPIGLPGQPVIVNITDAQIPPIVGIEFDFTGSISAPTNWVKLTDIINQSIMDIPLDDGTPATIDLTTTASMCGNAFCGFHTNGFPLPQHIQSLDPIQGSVYARGTVTFTWSGLKRSTDYRVFVFGYGVFGPIDQSITITGSGPPTAFNQVTVMDNLLINDTPASTDLLINFGKQVMSSATGTITVTSNLGNDDMSFAGLGIQEVLGPPSSVNCPSLLTLTGTNVGDNSDVNNMSLNQSSGAVNSTQKIAAGANVVYDGGTEINLNVEFEVLLTGLFEAYIGRCFQ